MPAPSATSPCLTDDALDGFVRGALAPGELETAQAHLDGCETCRRAVGVLAASAGDTRPARSGLDAGSGGGMRPLQRGDVVGRYHLVEPLGEGAMGVVWSAHDPELQREAALKFLRGGVLSEDERERLLREARALGRINHPNVVTVYEVESSAGGGFIAMEHMEGGNLETACRGGRRSWEDVLQLYLAAGEGLSAAHQVGLVHRDFKPQNVLLGAEGRPRVADFGLVRPSASIPVGSDVQSLPPASAWEPSPPPTASTVVPTGQSASAAWLAGTPAYMAPEQLRGGSGSERSDQFSFCVSLYQGLYDRLPFDIASYESLRRTQAEPLRLPARPALPRRLQRALRRGLSVDPTARYPSMRALLSALRPPRNPQRVGWMLTAVACAVLGVLVAVGLRQHRLAQCAVPDPVLVRAWNGDARARMTSAFARSGLPFAADSATRVGELLDGYVRSWSSVRSESCVAFDVRKTESAAVHGLRQRCLEQRRGELSALVEILQTPTRDVVTRSVQAVRSLEPAEDCALADELVSFADPLPRASTELRQALDDATARARAFEPRPALAALQPLLPRLRSADDPTLLAEALVLSGMLGAEVSAPESVATLKEAVWLAQAHHLDRWAYRAALELARSQVYNHPADAQLWTDYARSSASHLQGNGPPFELALLRARLARTEEDEKTAQTALADGRQQVTAAGWTNGPRDLELTELTASIEQHFGRDAAGALSRERVVALAEQLYGPLHPETARALVDLSTAIRTGTPRKAQTLRRALPILRGTYGDQSNEVGVALDRLAQALLGEHRAADAREPAAEAVAVLGRVSSGEAAEAYALGNLADVDLALERSADARAELEKDVAITAQLFGTGNYRLCKPLERLARIALADRRWGDAQRLAEDALQAWESGPRRARGGLVPQAQLDLAEAQLHLPGGAGKAQALAQAALEDATAAEDAPAVARAREWLAAHPRQGGRKTPQSAQ